MAGNKTSCKDNDFSNNINKLLDAFVSSIQNDDEMSELSAEAKNFWDDFSNVDLNICFGTQSDNFFILFDINYNGVLSTLFNKDDDENFIRNFSIDTVSQFISLSEDYCKEKNYTSVKLERIKFVLCTFANKIIHDQILCKYDEKRVENLNYKVTQLEVLASGFGKEVDNATKSLKKQTKDTKNELKRSIKDTNKKMLQFSSVIEESEKKINERSITILGIFAAIVLVFNASVSFYSSIIEAFSTASIYRVVLVLLIVGLIFASVLIGLFFYLEKVRNTTFMKIDKESFHNNKVPNSSTTNNSTTTENENNVKSTSLKPFIITIVCFIILVVSLMGCWWFGVVEKRNEHYSPKPNKTTVIATTTETERSAPTTQITK